jgi:hypothetical protein
MNRHFQHRRRRFFFFALFITSLVLLASLIVMFLWNATLPYVFRDVAEITYLQAMSIFILARILFGGWRGQFNANHRGFNKRQLWREKMSQMSEEERIKFKEEWKQRCAKK